jgi:hypothetical protein
MSTVQISLWSKYKISADMLRALMILVIIFTHVRGDGFPDADVYLLSRRRDKTSSLPCSKNKIGHVLLHGYIISVLFHTYVPTLRLACTGCGTYSHTRIRNAFISNAPLFPWFCKYSFMLVGILNRWKTVPRTDTQIE